MADVEKKTEQQKTESKPRTEMAKVPFEGARSPLVGLRNEIDRLFDEFATGAFRLPWRRSLFDLEPMMRLGFGMGAALPPAEVKEKENEYQVCVELPGMDEKATQIDLAEDVLTIRAEKKEEKEEKSETRYFSERHYGRYERSFRLPENVDRDRIEASMSNGVLIVTLPKTEPSKSASRRIEVTTTK